MRHQLVRLLGCGIQTHGMSDTRFLRKRHIRIQPIHAARAGIHQMTHLMVPASLQHIDKTIQVRFHVRIWIRDRITYACLGGQIHHRIEPLVGEKHPHRLPILQIHPDKAVSLIRMARSQFIPIHLLFPYARLLQATILQGRIIISIDIIQAHNLVSPLQ